MIAANTPPDAGAPPPSATLTSSMTYPATKSPSSTLRRTARLLSVLMPVYNERRTLRTIVGRVLASPTQIPLELIAVDDGSSDGSGEILSELAALEPRIK